MQRMKNNGLIIILLCALHVCSYQLPDNFPLWGSSWIIAQGDNQKVYPSVLPLRPKVIALVQFHEDKSTITYSYANLNHRTYRGSYEVVDDIKNQFNTTKTTITNTTSQSEYKIAVSYQPYNDTLWSADPFLPALFKNYEQVGRIVNGRDSLFTYEEAVQHKNNPLWTPFKPVIYGKRIKTANDNNIYTEASLSKSGEAIYFNVTSFEAYKGDDLLNLNMNDFSSEEELFKSYATKTHVFEWISDDPEFKTENKGYWQLHLFPEVWYYQRSPFDGQPLLNDEIKMTFDEAKRKKYESIDDWYNLELKYYRNPYLSDSASVIISSAFVNDGTSSFPLKTRDFIWLSAIKAKKDMDYEHFPAKMFRVSRPNPFSFQSYKYALYKLYSESNEEENHHENIETNCPNVWVKDKINSELIFPLPIQTEQKLVRNTEINSGNFTYNGCPCNRISELNNLTLVQLRRLLYLSIPMCNITQLQKAYTIYSQLLSRFTDDNDITRTIKRINQVRNIYENIRSNYEKSGVPLSYFIEKEDCPHAWTDNF